MRRWLALCAALLAAAPSPALAEDAAFEITEAGMVKFIQRLGTLSNTEVFQPTRVMGLLGFEFCEFIGFLDCPDGFSGRGIPLARCTTKGGRISIVPAGEPIVWQWWIGSVEFKMTTSGMTFSAVVRAQIGPDKRIAMKTVPATLTFHAASNSLRLNIDSFKASFPIQLGGETYSLQVDVAKLLSVSVPIEPQNIALRMPDSSTRNLTGQVVDASAQYLSGRVRMNFDVAF